jgi:putative addiction module component (TIGR02574 family)
MTKYKMLELHKLSIKDKIIVVQSLWDDIAKEQSIDNLPEEHKRILNDRIAKIDKNQAIFKPWSDVQEKYKSLQ